MRSPLPFLLAALVAPAFGQEAPDAAWMTKIREEGLNRSQVMPTLHQLCDVHGPRLMASPQFKSAAEWSVKQMTSWGLDRARLEPFNFGHPGWSNFRCTAHVVAPYQDPLTAEVLAWTPSTPGVVKASTVALSLPEEPTAEELDTLLGAHRGKFRGRIVLVGPHRPAEPLPTNRPTRHGEAELQKRFDPNTPLPAFSMERPKPKRAGALEPKEIDRRVAAFLVKEKAVARINDAALRNGQIRAFHNRTYDLKLAPPTLVLRGEDFGRLWRLMADGQSPKLELDIRNRTHPTLTQGLNVVAELTGTEKPDEVLLLGAHLDSWHTGTGATDNGASCAVMMETLRILKTVGAQPKRTIRIVLFDGEEQGLLGSQAYVQAHFGSAEAPKAEFSKLVGYLNMDGGAGQMRGITVFGPSTAAEVLREALAPWKDLGVVGANWHRNRPAKPDYADVTSFSHAGLTAMGLTQDPLEYSEYTWHTTLDTLERVPVQDVQRTATILAGVAFHLANRKEGLPRFSETELPKLPVKVDSAQQK